MLQFSKPFSIPCFAFTFTLDSLKVVSWRPAAIRFNALSFIPRGEKELAFLNYKTKVLSFVLVESP